MAFVYQAEKKASHINSSQTKELGPGAYLRLEELQVGKAFVPFNSSQPRTEKDQNQKNVVPGPGTYNIEQATLNEKVVVSSANEDIKIVEVPKPQSVFKSGSNRFKNLEYETPGPGEYNVGQALAQIKEWPDSKQKRDIIDQLMKLNKYATIPSIPSKVHIHGYTQNDNNELELNKLPQNIYTGLQGDTVGPDKYQLKEFQDVNQDKGISSWSKNQVQRFQKRQSKSVGPGHYDVQTQLMPLYKLKQTVGFASKTLRSSEARKGQIANDFLKKQRSIASSDATTRTRDQTEIDDSDSEYEYIEDATPGPGYYHNESTYSSISNKTKQERFQFFGSGQARFKEDKRITHIGPGDYRKCELSSFKPRIQPKSLRNKKPPFLSSNTRFEIKSIQDQKPGPQSYNPLVSLEYKLIQKVQKGYRGNFGTEENRFKPHGMEEYPGPGAYLEPIQENEEDKNPTSCFKSKINRGAFSVNKEQLKKPPVGSYNLDYFDIEKVVTKDNENDPELKIPYPPFGSSIRDRFATKKEEKRLDDDDDDDFDTFPRDRSANDVFKQKKRTNNNIKFGTKADRFNYKNKDLNPGPGKYHDTQSNPWNKRTYNIKFAEI